MPLELHPEPQSSTSTGRPFSSTCHEPCLVLGDNILYRLVKLRTLRMRFNGRSTKQYSELLLNRQHKSQLVARVGRRNFPASDRGESDPS